MTSNPSRDGHKLSDGWRYWKITQGSADHGTRKLSSIDPFDAPTPKNQQSPNRSITPSRSLDNAVNSRQISLNQTEGLVPKSADSSQTVTWTNFWNPLTYIPTESFSFPASTTLQPSTIEHDQLSTRSQSTSVTVQNQSGWFSWIWTGSKSQQNELDEESEEGSAQDLVTSMELKKSTKEYKKHVNSSDACWAWYQNHYNNNQFNGEISVLGTKSETSPVELSKYPIELNPVQPDKLESKFGVIVPDITSNYRPITARTQIRLGAQLYYNFNQAEKHVYLKKNINKPDIRYVLVISIVFNNNSKPPRTFSAKQVSDSCVESIKEIFDERVDDQGQEIEYQVESISLEIGKLKDSLNEDLFKLLINWRVDFKKIDFLFVNGYKQAFPLAAQLLQTLLSRGLMDNVKKTGLHGIDSMAPGCEAISQKTINGASAAAVSTMADISEMENLPWCKSFDLVISELISKYNVKMTFIGSHFNISSTLALQLSHPNIFRCLFIRNPNNPFSNFLSSNNTSQAEVPYIFNNDFEIQLLKLLLVAHNSGHQSSRLLIQLTKYFQPHTASSQPVPSLSETLNSDFFKNALVNTIHTTNLIKPQSLRIRTLDDDIINNEYNLVWTLHAFLNDYKGLANVQSLDGIKLLIQLYHTWKPRGKGMKDLKYMLEVLKIEDYSGAIFKECDNSNLG